MKRRTDTTLRPLLVLMLALALAACGQTGSAGRPGETGTDGQSAEATPDVAAPEAPEATEDVAAPAVTVASEATEDVAAPAATVASETTAAAMSTGGAAEGGDLLADVQQRGTLRIATDANYKPQSFKTSDGAWEGFDIDVGREIAKRMGVEPEFLDISFDVITAGSWNGRWDINIGSMTVTPEREEVLLFTTPYYYTPASFVVHQDSTLASVDELAGTRIGVGSATTYQTYLEGSLELEGQELPPPPAGADLQMYETDQLALQDLALGAGTRLDAVMTALPTAQDAITSGQPFKILGDPVFYENLAVALDAQSPMPSQGLRDEIDRIVMEMHEDGTLTSLSNKHYGIDLTTQK